MTEKKELVQGVKYDGGKPRWSLLPFREVEYVVKVLTKGSEKYADHNWHKIDNIPDRYFSACLRHISAWHQGEMLDPETKLPHIAHAICCLLFMLWKDEEDGKYKG